MNTNDHKLLAKFIIRNSNDFKCKKYQNAFILGSVEPDYNPFSYLKGSFKHKMLRGHHYGNSLRFLKRNIKALESKDKSKWNVYDYFRLGKVIHYMADDFTIAHNESFSGDLSEHCNYEGKLSDYFEQYLEQYKPTKRKLSERLDFTSYFEKAHLIYSRQKQKLSTDAKWISHMCWLTACHLTAPVVSNGAT